MRILLIQSLSTEGTSKEKVYPLGIILLADRLRAAGWQAAILDLNLETDPFGAVKERLLTFCPDVVGISLRNIDPLGNNSTSLLPPFIVTVRLVASLCPKVSIIVGGTGFSLFPRRLMQEAPEIRYGIVGEAEEALPILLSSLENPPLLQGLCWREGRTINVLPPAQQFDMRGYTIPDRNVLHPHQYLDVNRYVPAIGIEGKRGCRFRCAYCLYPKLQGRRVRCRPPTAVVDEMDMLHQEYGVESFHFTDPVVNVPSGHLEAICEELLRRKLKIRWNGFMREDYLEARNMTLFVRAGCESFSFSPDGLGQEAMDRLNKELKEEDVIRVARLAARTGVTCVYHFMVSVPGQSPESQEKGISFLSRLYELHGPSKTLGAVVLNNIRILPGTRLEKMARDEGVISAKTDLLYPVYYSRTPFDSFRYRLETMSLQQNVFMWQEVSVK